MTAWLLALVPQYGLWLLAATTFLSCLALPFPASILMLTAGGFAAAGDLVLWQAFLAAAAGGIAGDQLGYWAGRGLGTPALARLRRDPARDRMLARADALMQRRSFGRPPVQGTRIRRQEFSPVSCLGNLARAHPARLVCLDGGNARLQLRVA